MRPIGVLREKHQRGCSRDAESRNWLDLRVEKRHGSVQHGVGHLHEHCIVSIMRVNAEEELEQCAIKTRIIEGTHSTSRL